MIFMTVSTSHIVWNEVELSTGEKVQVTNGMYSKILEGNKNKDHEEKLLKHYMALII